MLAFRMVFLFVLQNVILKIGPNSKKKKKNWLGMLNLCKYINKKKNICLRYLFYL